MSDVAAAQPKFKDAWSRIQSTMGEKPAPTRTAKKSLDKDDFLKIMITQMKHQDPTKPFEADKMAAEMAQITSVEQMQNINKTLGQMVNKNQPMERLAMTNLIGKSVTIDKNRFPHTKGEETPLSFQLGSNAQKVKIEVVSDQGEVIYEKDLGAREQGLNTIVWDGKGKSTLPANSGVYQLRVTATGENERTIPTSNTFQTKIVGVSFQGQEPVFLVGDSKSQQKIALSNVIQIDDPSVASQAGLKANTPGMQAVSGSSSPSFFGFQKGVGSKPLEAGDLSAQAQAAIEQYVEQSKPAAEKVAPKEAKPEEKGWPNGLEESHGSE